MTSVAKVNGQCCHQNFGNNFFKKLKIFCWWPHGGWKLGRGSSGGGGGCVGQRWHVGDEWMAVHGSAHYWETVVGCYDGRGRWHEGNGGGQWCGVTVEGQAGVWVVWWSMKGGVGPKARLCLASAKAIGCADHGWNTHRWLRHMCPFNVYVWCKLMAPMGS